MTKAERDACRVVREARKTAGLTQVEFARLTGCNQSAVSLWESEKRAPSLYWLTRACVAGGGRLKITFEQSRRRKHG